MNDGTPGEQAADDAIRIEVSGDWIRQYRQMEYALKRIADMAYWQGTRMQEIAQEALCGRS